MYVETTGLQLSQLHESGLTNTYKHLSATLVHACEEQPVIPSVTGILHLFSLLRLLLPLPLSVFLQSVTVDHTLTH